MNYTFYTYQEGRHCKHCLKSLADQAHKSREFCQNEILEDGSVKSCHDDYHILRRKDREAPFRTQTAFQKAMSFAIAALYATCGDTVSVDQLDRYGIDLSRTIAKEAKGQNLYRFYFTGYCLEQLEIFTFKIHPHVSTL